MEWAQERDALWLADGGDSCIGIGNVGIGLNANYANPNTIVSASVVRGGTLLAGKTHRANHTAIAIAAQHHYRHYTGAPVKGSQARYANQ